MTLPWTPEEEAAYLVVDETRAQFKATLTAETNRLVTVTIGVLQTLGYRIEAGDAANLLLKFADLLPVLQEVESSQALQQSLTEVANP